MPKVFKVIYETDTGEVLPQCPLCGVYTFADEETAEFHFRHLDIPNRSMADITYEEKLALSRLNTEKRKPMYRVDTMKIKRHLKEREKEPVEKHIYGVTYQDLRPESVLVLK